MNKNYIFIVALFLSQLLNAQVPDWSWAKRIASTGDDFSQVVCTDVDGNVYVAGGFEGPTMALDSITLTNAVLGTRDLFIAKYNPAGKIIWAKRAGGISGEFLTSMHIAINGEILITGHFESPTITFGSTTLTNAGKSDIFVAKYDSNGNVLWAKGYGGTGNDKGESVSTDNSGNVLLTGYYGGKSIAFDSTTLLSNDTTYCDIFITKCDPFGNVVWAQRGSGTLYDFGKGIAADSDGNIFVTGYFTSKTIAFGNITLANTDALGTYSNSFVLKYDATGNLLWAKSAGGKASKEGQLIEIDKDGNTILAGSFGTGTIALDTITLENSGSNNDIFIVKYNTSGNAIWAKRAGGSSSEVLNGMCLDKKGHIYLTGVFFSGTVKFDSISLTNTGSIDMYLVKYNTTGNAVWAKNSTASSSISYGYGITADNEGVVYETGIFKNTISLGTTKLSGLGGYDGFLTKLCEISPAITANGSTEICEGGSVTLDAGAGYTNYQWSNGATTQQMTVSATGTYSVTVTNTAGCSGTASITLSKVVKPELYRSYDDATICGKSAMPELNFTSVPTGATFTWTNSNTSIGLSASGTGSIPSFTAIDTGTTVASAVITITANYKGCIFPVKSVNMNVKPSIDASFHYSDSVYCKLGANPIPIVTGQSGSFTSFTGLVFKNKYTGEIALSESDPGRYTISHTANTACSESSYDTITILDFARVDAGIDAVVCEGDSVQLLGSKSGVTETVLWKTSGTGKFNDATLVNPAYFPSSGDAGLGKVILSVSTNAPATGCGGSALDTMLLTVIQCKYPTGEGTFFKSCNVDTSKNLMSSVIQTTDGGYIFSGYLPNYRGIRDSYCLIKTDKYGDTIWTKTYKSRDNLIGTGNKSIVRQTKDGGYAFAFSTTGRNSALIKMDKNGVIQWSKKYYAQYANYITTLATTTDGGFMITGSCSDFNTATAEAYFLKVDSLGNIVWSKIYKLAYRSFINDIQQT
ncbi:MAG TPA: SBBP repeat-containing protein, partial [Bacteroidia bacterium]|nr:SBBP repeat-containing protein [Bacteroidia bacterium]